MQDIRGQQSSILACCDPLARVIHNSSINVIGVTNHLHLVLLSCQVPVPRQVTGPKGEPSTIILLSRENIKMTTNDLLLYPYINASLNSHQRHSCREDTMAQRLTAGQCAKNKRLQSTWPYTRDTYHTLFPKAQASSQKREWKDFRIQRWWLIT